MDAVAPPIAPACRPPHWNECDARVADGAGQGTPIEPGRGEAAQAEPDDPLDQRTEL